MKKYIILIVMFILVFSYDECSGQQGLRTPEQEHFVLTVNLDWADKMPSDSQKNILDDYGLNFHIEAGIKSAIGNLVGVEIKVGYEGFPTLYGGYSAYTGAVGLRMVSGYWEEWDYYVGFRASKVYRTIESGKAFRVNPGLEIKVTRNINDTFYGGFRYTYDKAYDQEIFDWEVKNRHGVYVTIGAKLFEL